MFEQFPYTDMHQLNLDWIIKIAKDFLDQYTSLQQMISDGEQSLTDLTQDGLNDLQEKADTLQGLLDAWYTEHSTDIANQLADALQDLNTWYTQHSGYLDQILQDNITAFTTAITAEGARVLDSIPDDYTSLTKAVDFLKFNDNVQAGTNLFDIESWLTVNEVAYTKNGNVISTTFQAPLASNPFIFAQEDIPVEIYGVITAGTVTSPKILLLNSDGNTVATLDTSNRYAAGTASMVKVDYGTGGTVTLDNIIIRNHELNNQELLKSVKQINSNELDENILSIEDWFDFCGNSYTENQNEYTVTINSRNHAIPCVFAPYDMDIHVEGYIRPDTATLPIIQFYNFNHDLVGIFTPINNSVDLKASYFKINYGNAGRIKLDLKITKRIIPNDPVIDNAVVVPEPDDFTWKTSQLHNKIYTDGKGRFVIKDFNIENNMYPAPAEYTFYVDNYHGNDNNNGLSFDSAFKTIKKAYDSCGASGTIYVAPGVYPRSDGTWSIGVISKSINLIGLGGMVYLSNMWFSDFNTSDGVLSAATSIVPYNVVDVAHTNPDGRFVEYTQKETVAEVQATPGTWASVNNILYVNPLANGWFNNKNIIVIRKDDANTVVEGAVRFYGENLAFIGGTTPFQARSADSTHAPNVFAKNCEFWYGQGDATYRNAVTIRGARTVIFENCKAMCNGGSDGFNYHDLNGYSPNVIEIGCSGMFNGDAADGSDQGSTIHENVHIIRINGIYAYNYGANIADDSETAQSWNLGCRCFKSMSAFPSQNANYMTYGADMWLDGCCGYSSTGNIAGNAAEIRQRLPMFYGELKSPQTTGDPTTY